MLTLKQIVIIAILGVFLTGCVTAGKEQYRGVAPNVWKKLNAEQRALIIDSALRDELGITGDETDAS